ncbi:MAG: hypothetical protein PHH69_05675 [Candidatus Omnitrophica bacterium]|nr:hypothetical protein [Candidatus Omnitrophota bacterium]MDD5611004.1 hypothetical protein [Candidatus Omnitrophota bacterium]
MDEEWKMEPTEKYICKHEDYEKKHPQELVAMEDNLDAYFKALSNGINPLQIGGGFIHNEREGIWAIDQKGGRRKIKLQQARLYIYPDILTKTLFLLTIGDKQTQRKQDIPFCREYVKKEIRGQVR